jgi:hypothetical protein
MPDSAAAAGSCAAVVASISFETPAAPGGYYTDTGNASLNHTLANNAGEPVVSYDPTATLVCSTGGYATAAFTCSFTVAEGEEA